MHATKSAVVLLVLGFGGAVSTSAFPARPDRPDEDERERRVASLVRQLGDGTFERREAAQRALEQMGPDVLPVIEKLGPQQDPEIRARLGRLRRELVGYVDAIRHYLSEMPEILHESKPPVPPELAQIVRLGQPRTGDFLLSLIADPADPLHRRATNTFVLTWDTMSARQIDTYVQRVIRPRANGRPKYPQGVDALLEMVYTGPYGWGSWPTEPLVRFPTRTTHYLDGEPYGKPFAYEGPGATTGWVRTKDLAPGRHEVRMAVEYEFGHRGATHRCSLGSKPFAFEVVAADTPDELIAPRDRDLDEAVRAAFGTAETEEAFAPKPRIELRLRFDEPPPPDPWVPQVTWRTAAGESGSLHVPVWRVTKPLPVDLCFEVTIRDVEGGKTYPADSLVVRRGTTSQGFFVPRDVSAFARGKSGFVPVRVVLRPSRGLALTVPEVTRYYANEIVSDVMRMKVGGE